MCHDAFDCIPFLRASQNCEKLLIALSCLSARMFAWNDSAPTGRILVTFDAWALFEYLLRRLMFY